jgi:hypothetical protein
MLLLFRTHVRISAVVGVILTTAVLVLQSVQTTSSIFVALDPLFDRRDVSASDSSRMAERNVSFLERKDWTELKGQCCSKLSSLSSRAARFLGGRFADTCKLLLYI